jgi:Tol biopolymer transport system component
MKLKLKLIILFLSLLVVIYSCDYGNNPKDYGEIIYKIYVFDLTDSSQYEIINGSNPIILPQSNKLLFITEENLSSKVWLYDFETKEKEIVGDNLHPVFFDDNVVSPDEKHIVFVRNNSLMLLHLDNSEVQIIDSSSKVIDIPVPKFSKDGKYIAYLSKTKSKKDSSNINSVNLNLYNLQLDKHIIADTILNKYNGRIEARFTNDSQKLYFTRSSTDQIEFTFYTLNNFPKLFRKKTIYTFDYGSKYWSIYNNKILILANEDMKIYDIDNNELSYPIKIKAPLTIFETRLVKNLDYLIGKDEKQNIYVINLKGEVKYKVKPNIEGQIYWLDYYSKYNYLLFATSRWKPTQN